jgi:hypothetical protein
LISVGQPVFAEDTWWHLAMGRAYAALGPWLEADPLLFTAREAPAPAAWLSGLLLHLTRSWTGFIGLRVLHVALVVAMFVVAFRALHRVSGSIEFASGATALFAAMSAYRLFQLRPELLSILFAIVAVNALVLGSRDPGSARKGFELPPATVAALLFAFWANAHAAFLLGPILLGAAVGGVASSRWVGLDRSRAAADRQRALLVALLVGTAATLINPTFAAPHLLYFEAGADTPELARITDEWARFRLFTWPEANIPPSPLSWCATWLLLLITPAVVVHTARSETARGDFAPTGPDPALLAIACASLVAMLLAVRFSWMSIFVLLAIGDCLRTSNPVGFRRGMGIAMALATAFTFVAHGAWPMISRGVRSVATYAEPYPAGKHHAHAVWFLADTGLEGRLFNDYSSGNFLGYWLAPELETFINGSLNVPRETMDDAQTIGLRGWGSPEGFEAMLDRYEIDVFFGTGLPREGRPNRPVAFTTRHLEGSDQWIPIFRNLTSGIYLRRNASNQANLERVAAYYARAGVPFEGRFDPHETIRAAPQWAIDHGVIPRNWSRVLEQTRVPDPTRRLAARSRQASILAILGAYEAAAAIDRSILRQQPHALDAGRRLLFSLLQPGDTALEEASILADALEAATTPDDTIARVLIDAARNAPSLDPDQRRAFVSLLPMLNRQEASRLGAGFVPPDARI